jgi:hypothetical protein
MTTVITVPLGEHGKLRPTLAGSPGADQGDQGWPGRPRLARDQCSLQPRRSLTSPGTQPGGLMSLSVLRRRQPGGRFKLNYIVTLEVI